MGGLDLSRRLRCLMVRSFVDSTYVYKWLGRSVAQGKLTCVSGSLVVLLSLATIGRADERAFTFVYEVTTMPKGHAEYEQWVTWKTSKAIDSDFDRLDFRHELEYGVTDHWQVALYLSDWRYQDGDSVRNDRAQWRDIAFETIYQLSDPTVDPLGMAVYGEIKGGDELIELEAKLLLQKNIGSWIVAWNGTFEAEWEGEDYHEDKGELQQTLGVSYQIDPRLSLGAELIHEVEYNDWSHWEDHTVYLGPNISYRAQGWWMTVTPTFQLTDVDGEADFQTRLIFGFDF